MTFNHPTADANADIAQQIEPDTDEIIQHIEWLMTWYSRRPSEFVAKVIVSRLESLRLLEQNGEPLDPEWLCQRLIGNWKYLSTCRRARVAA